MARSTAIGQLDYQLSKDGRTLLVSVPARFQAFGSRKKIITPDGASHSPASHAQARQIDNALLKALARAFRWRKLLEDGTHDSIEALATAENINASYVSRVLRLTLLAPALVEAILAGTQPPAMQLDALLKSIPVEWDRQMEMWRGQSDCGPGRK